MTNIFLAILKFGISRAFMPNKITISQFPLNLSSTFGLLELVLAKPQPTYLPNNYAKQDAARGDA